MPTASVSVNGVDLASLRFYVGDAPDWLDAPARAYSLEPIAGLTGGVTYALPQEAPRTLAIRGTLNAQSLAERRTYRDQLVALLERGLLAVRVDDGVNAVREIRGFVPAPKGQPVGHPIASQVMRGEIDLLCPEPVWRDVAVRVYAFGSTPTAMPLGTRPSAPLIRVAGSATNPTITYRAASGDAVATLAYTGTLASTDYLDIDVRRKTVWKYASGVRANARASVTVTWFVLDPQDGDYALGASPTLEVSSGSGVAIYPRQWA